MVFGEQGKRRGANREGEGGLKNTAGEAAGDRRRRYGATDKSIDGRQDGAPKSAAGQQRRKIPRLDESGTAPTEEDLLLQRKKGGTGRDVDRAPINVGVHRWMMNLNANECDKIPEEDESGG